MTRKKIVFFLFLTVEGLIMTGCSNRVQYQEETYHMQQGDEVEKKEEGMEAKRENEKIKEKDEKEEGQKIEIELLSEISEDTLPKGTGTFLEIPKRTMGKSLKKSFVYMPIVVKEEIWQQLISDKKCEKWAKIYGLYAYQFYVPFNNVNTEYLEYLKRERKEEYKAFKKENMVILDILLYTYEDCNKSILFQGTEVHEDAFSCDFLVDYQAGDSICISEKAEDISEKEQVYIKIELSEVSIQPDWYFDSGDQEMYLSIPYKKAQELFPDKINKNSIKFFLSAKEGYEQEFRDYATELTGKNCVYEGSFFE